METTIRRATPDDVDTLVRLGRETFVETFGHLYPPADLAYYLETAYAPDRTAADLADPRKAQWIVEKDGEAIGYALAGPCDLPVKGVTPECGELKRLYLYKAHQGGGVGARLMRTVFDWLAEQGRTRLWIGVWSENYGAQRLYMRHGFEKVGEYHFPVGETRDLEFVLRREPTAVQ